MTDFRTWIVGQSAKLGYDFNALTREDQENIISALLSYAEDAFRSQCDYPDMRFGKRRGIYRAKNSEELPPSSKQKESTETKNYILSSNSQNCTDDGCFNNSLVGCSDSNHCIDTNCTNSTGCINSICEDESCYNYTTDCKDSDCRDEQCRNQTTCTDEEGCYDNYCRNTGECPDTTEDGDDPEVIDNYCTNIGNNGCLDVGKSVDNNCNNTNSCNDNGNLSSDCKDDNCSNYEGPASCIDSKACIDSLCWNNSTFCSDSEAEAGKKCVDQLCKNYEGCSDNGSDVNQCHDNACLNSSSSDLYDRCIDGVCLDKPCLNAGRTENTCKDTTCVDHGCVNAVSTYCHNELGYTDHPGCINLPDCGGGDSTDFVGCVDIGSNCVSTETGQSDINRECVDAASKACFDQGSSSSKCKDSQYCFNEGNCFDKDCDDNSCNNNSTSTCRDNENCTDNSCVNNGFCQNIVTQCQDNNCQNVNCINIGLSCTNDPQSCVDTRCVPYLPLD